MSQIWLVFAHINVSKLGDQVTNLNNVLAPQNHLSTYTPSQPLQRHNNSPAVKSEGQFYLADNRYPPITLPSASIEFAGNEYQFVAHQSSQDGANFGGSTSVAESYPVGVDAMGHEHFPNHGHNGSRDPDYNNFEDGTTSFM